MIAEGSAFLDSSGRVIVADAGFSRVLGIAPGGLAAGLRQRAEAEPHLAALLRGEGPASVTLAPRDGMTGCVVRRTVSDGGSLLTVASSASVLQAPVVEYAMQAMALSRLAGGVAHEVKNPLNAMALQLALLGDKMAGASEALSNACAGNLNSLRNQVGRINEVVRRFLDVADPAPGTAFDAGALVADAGNLFGHEGRRRRIAFTCDAGPGPARAAGDPARAARLVLGLLWSSLLRTPESGRLALRVTTSGEVVLVTVEHTLGPPDPGLEWVEEALVAAAREVGGGLEGTVAGDVRRVVLALPKER